MSASADTLAKIESILGTDGRFSRDAYLFTLEALSFTLERRRKKGQEGHIDGRELLFGIREYAGQGFGFLAASVFRLWGVTKTDDFGDIVFALVDVGLLSKQESDTKDDFAAVYDFADAFERDFLHS